MHLWSESMMELVGLVSVAEVSVELVHSQKQMKMKQIESLSQILVQSNFLPGTYDYSIQTIY